jgi:hypothetical protein
VNRDHLVVLTGILVVARSVTDIERSHGNVVDMLLAKSWLRPAGS